MRVIGVAAATLLSWAAFSGPVAAQARLEDYRRAERFLSPSIGQLVFEGRVERNLQTLMKWAARDNDRTMLYGAELKVKLAR